MVPVLKVNRARIRDESYKRRLARIAVCQQYREMKSRIRRIIYLVVGWVCLILGVIGAFLPLLPTTPFLLVTAYCFAKSSPRLHAAIMNHPRFGPPLRDWQENRVIRPRAKITASIVLLATVTLAWVQIPMARFPLQLIPTFACLGAATFILTRKSR